MPLHLTFPESSARPSPWLSLDPSNTVTGLILHSFVLEVSPPHFCSASGALQQHPRVLGRGIDAFSPRHLPAAPRLSPHHPFLHHHWTEVCRSLHIHRQRTHCGPISQRRQLHEGRLCGPSRVNQKVALTRQFPGFSHGTLPLFYTRLPIESLLCSQTSRLLLPTVLSPWPPRLFSHAAWIPWACIRPRSATPLPSPTYKGLGHLRAKFPCFCKTQIGSTCPHE